MTLKDAHRVNFSSVPIEAEMWMVGGEMEHLKQPPPQGGGGGGGVFIFFSEKKNKNKKKQRGGGGGGGGESIATYDMLPCWIFGYCWRT